MISVLMSVFNSDKYIRDSLVSVIETVSPKLEVILVDDGSVDDTKNIVLHFLESENGLEKDLIFIENAENVGLPKSLNKAFSKSKCNYIARMDGDDVCLPDRFSRQLRFMLENNEIDILGSNAILIDSDSQVVGKTDVPLQHEDIVKALAYKNPIIHPSVIMKREVLEKLGGYDEALLKAQDLDLWHRAAKFGFRFANMPDFLIQYRVDLEKKPIKTVFKGFRVSFSHAVRNRSVKGAVFSLIDLIKYFLIKLNVYTPRSIRKKS